MNDVFRDGIVEARPEWRDLRGWLSLIERRGVEVEVDEDEPAPRVGEHLGQRPRVVDLREVPLARHVLQAAVEVPGEAVERAAQLAVAARLLLQLAATVQAAAEVFASL